MISNYYREPIHIVYLIKSVLPVSHYLRAQAQGPHTRGKLQNGGVTRGLDWNYVHFEKLINVQ